MKTLLSAALLVALAGAARSDEPPQAAPAESSRKAETAKRSGAKERPKGKRGAAAARPPAKPAEKAPDAKGEKPCEPVKPCPID